MRRKIKRKIRRNRRRGGEARGNNADRARRKKWLLKFFGTGTTAPCAHCEKKLTYETITADRIVPGIEGGSYRHENIIPSCMDCNTKRHAGVRHWSDDDERRMKAAFEIKKNPRRYKLVRGIKFSKKYKAAYRRRQSA